MVGMQNSSSMFYLFKFSDLWPYNYLNNSEVCLGPSHHPFFFHTMYDILLTFEVVQLLASMLS